MGLFWDLLQQSQISDQESTARSLDQRVAALEASLYETQRLQRHFRTPFQYWSRWGWGNWL